LLPIYFFTAHFHIFAEDMFVVDSGRKLYGAIATIWALFVITIFFSPALAAPPHLVGNWLSLRANEAPGIGVELELGKVVIKAVGKELTDAQMELIKGEPITPVAEGLVFGKNWQLTLDINKKNF